MQSIGSIDDLQRLLASGDHTMAQVQQIRAFAQRAKPRPDYDTISRTKSDYYHRRAHSHTKTELARRYPTAHTEMPEVSIDYLHHMAVTDATAYDEAPARHALFGGVSLADTDNPTPDIEERSAEFAALLEASRADKIMREVERELMAAHTIFLRLGWDRISVTTRGQGRPTIVPYWPHEVDVICHPDAPADMRAAIAIVALRSGDKQQQGGGDCFELWTRAYTETDTQVEFSQWTAEVVDEKGSRPLFGDGLCPIKNGLWLAMHDGLPTRSVYLDVDSDVLTVAKSINASWSSAFYQWDMAGSPQGFIVGGEHMEGKTIEWGPGRVALLPSNVGNVGSFEAGFDIGGVDMADRLAGQVALTRQQSPGSFSSEPGTPESGVARRIRNIPQERASRERKQVWKDFEEQELLPALVSVSDYWGGTSIGHQTRTTSDMEGVPLADISYRVDFAEPPEYEDKQEHQDRLLEQHDRGLITKARLAVDLGVFSTEEEAIEAYGEEAGMYKPAQQQATPTLSGRIGEQPEADIVESLTNTETEPDE